MLGLTCVRDGRMPVGSRSNLRPAVRPKIVKKKTNKFVRFHADLFKRMAVSLFLHTYSLMLCSTSPSLLQRAAATRLPLARLWQTPGRAVGAC